MHRFCRGVPCQGKLPFGVGAHQNVGHSHGYILADPGVGTHFGAFTRAVLGAGHIPGFACEGGVVDSGVCLAGAHLSGCEEGGSLILAVKIYLHFAGEGFSLGIKVGGGEGDCCGLGAVGSGSHRKRAGRTGSGGLLKRLDAEIAEGYAAALLGRAA